MDIVAALAYCKVEASTRAFIGYKSEMTTMTMTMTGTAMIIVGLSPLPPNYC